jgi:hypothetical protein
MNRRERYLSKDNEMTRIEAFLAWWNQLAIKNQKIKFRNSREAAEFVRHMVNSAGPNEEMVKMREEYVAIRKAREQRAA